MTVSGKTGWRRVHMILGFALLLALAGACIAHQELARCWPMSSTPPDDPRAYKQRDCGWTSENTQTFPNMLQYYGINLPAGVAGLRYYSDDTGFNGPDTLFLLFNVPAGHVSPFLASLAATRSSQGPSEAISTDDALMSEFGIDWSFEPHRPYAVYKFGTDQSPHPAGTVIIDESGSTSTIYVISVV